MNVVKTGWYFWLVLQPILAEHFVGKFGFQPSPRHICRFGMMNRADPERGRWCPFGVVFSSSFSPPAILRKNTCP